MLLSSNQSFKKILTVVVIICLILAIYFTVETGTYPTYIEDKSTCSSFKFSPDQYGASASATSPILNIYNVETGVRGKRFLFPQPAQNTFKFDDPVVQTVRSIFASTLTNCGVRHKCHVMDIGMNSGFFTALSASLGAQVLAIEPQIDCHVTASLAIHLNDNCAQVETMVRGAWSDEQTVSVGAGCANSFKISNSLDRFVVRTIVPDSFIRQRHWTEIDIIRINTEGSEIAILRGLKEALNQRLINNLIVQLKPELWYSLGFSVQAGIEVFRELEDLGYEFTLLANSDPKNPYPVDITEWQPYQASDNTIVADDLLVVPKKGIDKIIYDRKQTESKAYIWIHLTK